MVNEKYFELFRIRIQATIKEDNVTPDFHYFNDLYSRIIDSVKLMATLHDLPQIEEPLLEEYFEDARNYYVANNPIRVERFNALTKKGYNTWLTDDRKKEIKWNYFNRYFTLLEKSGRADEVIMETQQSSYDILGKLGDPQSHGEFYHRGLVVGSIQSGKTGNFNAVINGAIDAGYRIILVLAGLYNDLRSQTQLRIEKEVIGMGIIDIEKGNKGIVGVGKIKNFSNDNHFVQVRSITSYAKDFDKSLGDADFNPYAQTNILICKKNTSVLRNLLIWLDDYKQNNSKYKMPLLLLDDEADNASLNNSGKKGREYASTINGHIRALLDMFEKRSYLGYTATPFANVLQDRNEKPINMWKVIQRTKGENIIKEFSQVDYLFPDDFIVLLNPPSNYIGAKEIFETITPIENKACEKLPLIEVVNDHIFQFPTRVYKDSGKGIVDYRNKDEFESNNGYELFPDYSTYRSETRGSLSSDEFPNKLPRSLKESILCFLLTIAVRESRKEVMLNSPHYNPHNTMLIHVSRYTNWQNKTQIFAKKYLDEVREKLENEDITSSIFKEFKYIWLKYYSQIMGNIHDYLPKGYVDPYLTPVSFETIQKRYLVNTIENLDVKAINSISKETLEYPKNNPKKVIAIGGNRLSRGFTLEGLTVNYFIRTTNYSDTLLQMGRWFGYRPGYLDCCKLFATQDSISKFDITTLVIEELEGEFRKMEEKEKTPENFRLRVRKHPGTLRITRPSILNKTNTKEIKWSYQDQLEMTTKFSVSKNKIENIWNHFISVIAPKFSSDKIREKMYYYETDIEGISSILRAPNNFDMVTCTSILKFLELCNENNKLSKWTIALKTTGNATNKKGKGTLLKSESCLPDDIKMAVRNGPSNKAFRNKFLEDEIFRPTGNSANIMSSPKDISILLNKDEIRKAESNYIEKKLKELIGKNPLLSHEEALKNIRTIPERVYRECFSEQEGILVIYLFDSFYSFLQQHDSKDPEFKEFVEKKKINLNIPLIGYAIGFPPIEDDPGGIYVQGDYDLETEEEYELDLNDEDSELPDDSSEVINAHS